MENVDWMNKKYDFHWDNLDVILGGKSLLDATYGLRGFPLNSREEASRFLSSYGFDYDNPIEQAEVLGNYREAIIFIRKTFLYPENPEGLRLDIPKSILELLCAFFLFRFFDIFKFFPVRNIDRWSKNQTSHWKQSFGVIADDLIAGIQAWISLSALIHFNVL